MDRIYDLNERRKCVTAVLKVADKEFRISRVVTGVRVLYSNFLTQMGQLLQEIGNLDTQKAEDQEIKNAIEKAEAFKKTREETTTHCLELLLTKNGYEYDKAWWDENADEYDVRSFIEICISKDADGSKKKRNEQKSQTMIGSVLFQGVHGTT